MLVYDWLIVSLVSQLCYEKQYFCLCVTKDLSSVWILHSTVDT